jgi:hypothetical protein
MRKAWFIARQDAERQQILFNLTALWRRGTMPQHARHDDEDTVELYEDTVELPATSPELPIDAQAIVEWRKEAGKDFKCGIPQTVKAVNPYSTVDQAAAAPARIRRRTLDDMRRMSEQIKRNRALLEAKSADAQPLADQGRGEAFWWSSLLGTLSVLRRWFSRA